MASYRVAASYEVHVRYEVAVTVEANSPAEALSMVQQANKRGALAWEEESSETVVPFTYDISLEG